MAIRILVADPDMEKGKELASFLVKLGYEADSCMNGRTAQLKMYNKQFFAIILSLDIQEYSGGQVLKFIRTNHPSTKVILTMKSEQTLADAGLDRNTLAKQGVFDVFIGAEVASKDIQGAIEGHRDYRTLLVQASNEGASEEQEMDLSDDRFVQIRIEEFVSIKAVQFDIFIQLRSGRYVKILHAGDTFSRERLDKYKNEKKVEFLYFLKEDRIKFIRVQNFVAEKAAANANISLNTKVSVVKGLSQVFVEAVFTEGLKPLIFDQGKVLCDNVYEIIHKNDDLFKLMRDYSVFDPSLYTHSYLVGLFSGMIVKQFEWESRIINETLVMAALFHDIGCTKLAPEIREMSYLKMTPEQLGLYKAHCELGVQILSEQPVVPQAVKQIVLQHHERISGEGFPYGIRSHRILVLAQIVGLADEFTRHMVDNKLQPPAALRKMLSDPSCVKRHSAVILESFLKVFADPRKIAQNMGQAHEENKGK
ncbi:MAG: HD domain-containing protein [Oligoflexia bacterium]|nr:HD domain-containing protein [Oligoflexia bacterium]